MVDQHEAIQKHEARFAHKLQDNVLLMLWTKNPSFEAYGQKQGTPIA
jgi:hypothetical protein